MDQDIKLVQKKTGVKVEKIDVLRHPLITMKDGIKWIPAAKIKGRILYGKKLNHRNLILEIQKTKE